MPDWSLLGDGQRFEANAGDGNVQGTLVTANASANTKGNYAELIASTTFRASGIWLTILPYNAVSFLLDIAVGAAGSESVILPDIYVDQGLYIGVPPFFPIAIPPGTRLAARCQASTGGSTVRMMVNLVGQGIEASSPLQRVIAYGADTATSKGTQIDPGGSAYTKGSYAQLTASTTQHIRQLIMMVGKNANAAMTDTTWFFDIAVGGAGSEQIIIPDHYAGASSALDGIGPTVFGAFPASIPTGSRLAVRSACRITDATDRLLNVALYGID